MSRRVVPLRSLSALLAPALVTLLVAVVAPVLLLSTASPAAAHIERPAYWPDPAPDCTVKPCAGGKVPRARSLFTALDKSRTGRTRVVCQGHRTDRPAANPSLGRLQRSLAYAREHGYKFRPTERPRRLTEKHARQLWRFNVRLLRACTYHHIQAAVTDSGNNDRVVVLPGVYTEPRSRAFKTHDPACDKYESFSDFPRTAGAATYKYHYYCPNDANLIAVIGRKPGTKAPPQPPRLDRRGIPDLGPCIRCNLQLEGSGLGSQDVVVEAGRAAAGNGGPSGVGAAKDVGIAAQRADGFVLRNVTVRHAREHGIYVMETDGYLLDRFRSFYNGLYGTLTFVSDHGVHQTCEAAGHGDSGVYPGAPPETGEQRAPGTRFRYNQQVRRCDLHHNLAGYSATSGNAVWVHHNNFYDNALGLQTDVVTAAGHPGFPDDSQLIERNYFYSNNFNPYAADSDVKPAFPFPVGTGMWIAGGNNHQVRNNRFWNNWRRGVMLFAVPDLLICGPDSGNQQAGCDPLMTSTSHRNRFHHNVMGRAPDGRTLRNGTDFWWDSFPGNQANCWWANSGVGGAPTTSPLLLPDCFGGTNPALSLGIGDVVNQGELISCLLAFEADGAEPLCPWFTSPPRPGARAAAVDDREAEAFRETFTRFCEVYAEAATCRETR
ncbi:right-handed parallel beta-helix repeat-containing protein [Nocardioides speluncae]|uniref:right-handed parallel beta-helix repeat-containing protein n=1 Tax=Nocardioides speluncae TaxID=2670337 RepID=UPI000D698230|nr:right-handed parallel beta-helix repeat-containing protein [Nocardioides speluncae]